MKVYIFIELFFRMLDMLVWILMIGIIEMR